MSQSMHAISKTNSYVLLFFTSFIFLNTYVHFVLHLCYLFHATFLRYHHVSFGVCSD